MIATSAAAPLGIDKFWACLNAFDKYQYNYLRLSLSNPSTKNMRNKRISSFKEAIDSIRAFSIRGQADDNLRCFICGIAWLPEGIAINTHQLKVTISKCKSSINGSLQKMGFTADLSRLDTTNAIVNYFPFLKDNNAELRKWSIRKYPEGHQPCPSPPPTITPEIKPAEPVFEIALPKTDFALPKTDFAPQVQQIDVTIDVEPISDPLIDDWDLSFAADSWL